MSKNSIAIVNAAPVQQWHALYTRHQHEKFVAQSLLARDYHVFLPLYGVARRWSDRTKNIWLPLFPCYVFVRGGMDRHLQMLMTSGVVSIVQVSGEAAIIPQNQIDAVRQLVDASLHVEPHPFLERGDRVRVTSGPLTGIEGILIRKKGSSKLLISMELLCQSVAAEIDISCVEPIGPQPVTMRLYSTSISA